MTQYFKYPKTPHLPWSEGLTKSDKKIKTTKFFKDKKIIVSEKMDGECTSIYNDHIHARSIDSANHPSRDWVKAFSCGFQDKIMGNMRICGENLYAKHSIFYKNLPSYFMTFSAWNEENCLSWDASKFWFNYLGIESVPVIYEGIYNEKLIKDLWSGLKNKGSEGYVIRLAESFKYKDFNKSVAKFVRKNHVQTDEHWMQKEIEKKSFKK